MIIVSCILVGQVPAGVKYLDTLIYFQHNNSLGPVKPRGYIVINYQLYPSSKFIYCRDSTTSIFIKEMENKNKGFISGNIATAKCYNDSGITRTFNCNLSVSIIVEN